MPRVLIVAQTFSACPGDQVAILQRAGLSPEYFPADRNTFAASDLRECVRGYEAVLAGSEPYSAELIAGAVGLRVIARVGVGYDAVDVRAATRHGVAVTIAPGTNEQAVAEHTVAMILCLGRRLIQRDRAVRGGAWPRVPMLPPVRSRTLGIVGLGRVGKEVALRAKALGMKVIVYEPLPDMPFLHAHHLDLVPFEDLLARSEYVSLHLPLTPETAGLINRDALRRMKPGSALINTSRGGLVVEADLVEALRDGHLSAAALDVLQHEPPRQEHPLLSMENVLLTPHIAGIDALSVRHMAEKAAGAVSDLFRGRWPADCVVNSELEADWKW